MSTSIKISKVKAIAIFVALGFKTADKWADDRINKRISALHENVDEDTLKGVADETVRNELSDIIKKLEAGDTVVVGDEDAAEETPAPKKGKGKKEKPAPAPEPEPEPEAEEADDAEDAEEENSDETDEEPAPEVEETPAPKKGKGKKEKPKADEDAEEKPAKAPKAKPETDALGSRVGSQAAAINACIGKKWTTAKEVAEKTKLSEARVRGHFKHLEGKELITLDAEKGAKLV